MPSTNERTRVEATEPESAATGIRSVSHRAIKAGIAAVGLRLFIDKGFDDTTVDEIAAAFGMSRRTFFRYFSTKEAVVFEHYRGREELIVGRLINRPSGEREWDALHRAFDVFVELMSDSSSAAREIEVETVIQGSTLLRGLRLTTVRQLQGKLTEALVTRAVARGEARPDAVALSALTGAALGCLEAAYQQVTTCSDLSSIKQILDRLMCYLRPISNRDVTEARSKPF